MMADYKPPYPSKQIAFQQLLVAARTTILHGALADALEKADPDVVGRQMSRLAPAPARRVLAKAGIRDEQVFVTPAVLQAQPTTLGYYRLLLGVSKKAFYTTETGLRPFQAMEEKDLLREALEGELPALCNALNSMMAELITQLSPTVARLDLEQLPLLTLGAQSMAGGAMALAAPRQRTSFWRSVTWLNHTSSPRQGRPLSWRTRRVGECESSLHQTQTSQSLSSSSAVSIS